MKNKISNKKLVVGQFLLVLIISLSSLALFCQECYSSWSRFLYSGTYSLLLWFFLWYGNSYVTHVLSRRYSWLKHPIKRLIIGITLSTIYTTLIVYLVIMGYQYFTNDKWDQEVIKNNILISLLITFVISMFMHARSFFLNWRKLELNAEKLKNENLSSQYESLKNQLNPHFLFNSFNALTNLIYQDQDQAAKFVKQLSIVYRYLLDQHQKELVTLQEEINFAKAYLFLEKIRYGENLNVIFNIEEEDNFMLPPLSIQTLIENAIKHNIISKEEPLTIKIETDRTHLVISNNLQIKTISRNNSTKIGLANLKARYEILSDKSIEIIQDDSQFSVRIPLLNLQPTS